MTQFCRFNKVPLEHFTAYFEKLRDEIIGNAEAIAKKNGLEIEWIGKKNFRKDDRVKSILEKRGDHPGLVHIFKGVEPCNTFRVHRNRERGHLFLTQRQAKCLHFYFYFIDPDLGLCYVRIPTWTPFRFQFYFNGHNWLARRLQHEGIDFTQVENAFIEISDFDRAQEIASQLEPKTLHTKLDGLASHVCPFLQRFRKGYHWSLMQVEHCTDVVFDSSDSLQPIYDHLVRVAVQDVKAEDVATFFGRRLDGRFVGEIGNHFATRIKGTRIRHYMGKASIKMYDKFGRILRIETTANDVTFFKHRRLVEQRDGSTKYKIASLRKRIYSLPDLEHLLEAANRRYLEFISALDDPSSGNRNLTKVSRPVRENDRSNRGFNFFDDDDLKLLVSLARGEFNISGLRNRDLQSLLRKKSHQVSRLLKRLRLHGLIKKVAHTYKYYLTKLGKLTLVCALHLRQSLVIPSLA
jgi:hypothetical protein